MKRLLRLTVLLSAAIATPLMIQGDRPAFSQERQGCFMVDNIGQLRDLSDLCPQPDAFVSSTPPAIAQPQQQEVELGTGDIQVTLRWATTDDLDLAVVDPAGTTVAYYNPMAPSGGQLDVDANAGCFGSVTGTPIENIFWPPGEAPEGNYEVQVNLFQRCAGGGPISFEVRLLVQGEVQTLTGTVDDGSPIETFAFSLPQ